MRQHSKALAIASNYKATSSIQTGSSVRSPVTSHVPTVRDGMEVAILQLPDIPGVGATFDLQALTITAQTPADGDLVFKLYQLGSPDVDLSGQVQLTLPASERTAAAVGDPLQGGLDRTKKYFLHCESANADNYAQGVTVTYTIGGF